MKIIIALDQGTTSSRAIAFDEEWQIVASAQYEFTQYFPEAGWVEHHAEEIWDSQKRALEDVLQILPSDATILALGISNQRETAVAFSRHSLRPLHRAIVWQDQRTAKDCEALKLRIDEEHLANITGLRLDPYFSASKYRWLLQNQSEVKATAELGDLCLSTIDTWLLMKLSSGSSFVTDRTNASRTLLYDIRQDSWSEELLNLFEIPRDALPEVRPSSGLMGYCTLKGRLKGVPIMGIAGDQQAALFGQGCISSGMAKSTYGTGCFLLTHCGDEFKLSKNGLLTSLAATSGQELNYVMEGSIFIGGALIQWFRDQLDFIKDASEIEALAQSVSTSAGLVIVPALSGLGAPYWNNHARGSIFGLTRGSSKAHIARAALESIALQVCDVVRAFESDLGRPIAELRVDGGASKNSLLLQLQADLLGTTVLRPRQVESTALGAALLAARGLGILSSDQEITKIISIERKFEPTIEEFQRQKLLNNWKSAISCCQKFAAETHSQH